MREAEGMERPGAEVGILLFVVWVATLCYIWLPNVVPDFLHLRKSAPPNGNKVLRNGLMKLTGPGNGSMMTATEKEMGVSPVHVVITSDGNTVGGMLTLINSIVSNTEATVMFHLVTDQETKDHLQTWLMKTKLQKINYEIKVFPTEWVEGKIKVRGGREELASPMNYARYYLPRLFPNIKGRVVFIDDDCIVQDDIAQLYSMKIQPGHLAAFSEDCIGMSRRITFMQNKHFKELNIQPTTCSFNTGVFVTDLSDWRKHNITQQLEHWLVLNTREELYGNERGGGGSQPPMMLVFYNKYTPIDQQWHVHFLGWTVRSSYARQYIKSAKLLHWNGRFKPWLRTAPFQEFWDKYFLPDPTGKFVPIRKTSKPRPKN
ncbi:hypothetical protein BaRGS_00006903 [Batillaria attramentaria]|uniref:Glycosyltransferase 8 domain-containing protein 1 n=1 Tax=Batillaria attramentaria TaxID=370345 RepID=A0ABD0LR31_9CAEN